MVDQPIMLATIRIETAGAELGVPKKTAKHKQWRGLLKRARDGEDFAKARKRIL